MAALASLMFRNICNINRPCLIWLVYDGISKEIRTYLSLLHPFGKIHLRIDWINIHFIHVTSGLASTDMITTCFQLCGHLSCTPCRVIGMKMINNLFAGKFGF